jgi:hypothetical protein
MTPSGVQKVEFQAGNSVWISPRRARQAAVGSIALWDTRNSRKSVPELVPVTDFGQVLQGPTHADPPQKSTQPYTSPKWERRHIGRRPARATVGLGGFGKLQHQKSPAKNAQSTVLHPPQPRPGLELLPTHPWTSSPQRTSQMRGFMLPSSTARRTECGWSAGWSRASCVRP